MNRSVICLTVMVASCKSMRTKTKEFMSKTLVWRQSQLLMKWIRSWKKVVTIDMLALLIWIRSLRGHTVSLWLGFNSNRSLRGSLRLRLANWTWSIWLVRKGRRKLRRLEADLRKGSISTWHFQLLDKLSRLWSPLTLLIFHTEIPN